MDEPVTSLPYADRQLLVVVDDAIIQAEKQAAAQAAEQRNEKSWVDYALPILVHSVSGVVFAYAVESAIEGMKSRQRLRDTGRRVLSISRSTATAITFPPGHPRDGVLYVGHPTNPLIYFTAAQFHRMTFEHKFVEAINLLMSLGAVEMTVEHVLGWSRDFSAKLSIPVLSGVGDVGATAGREQSQGSELLFTAKLKNESDPAVPEGLVWYPHEVTWQAVARGRMSFGLTDFSLTVRYEDDFGVNAGLKLSAGKAGLDLAGHFEDHVATVWRIAGKFA